MRIVRKNDVEAQKVLADREGNPAEGTFKQILIPDGPNFILRVFTVKPGGRTPKHSHPSEHEVYVLSGEGRAAGESEFEIAAGDAVYVAPGDLHCFVNTGEEDLLFICVVPKDAS